MKRDLNDWHKRCEALIKLCNDMAVHLPQAFKDEAASLIAAVREASKAPEPESEAAPEPAKKARSNG